MATNKRCIMECVDKDGKPRMATPLTALCIVCGSNISGWTRRRPAERLRYREVLALRTRRMEVATDEGNVHTNVVDIRPRIKRARAAKAARRSV
jgi:hypothetical protein